MWVFLVKGGVRDPDGIQTERGDSYFSQTLHDVQSAESPDTDVDERDPGDADRRRSSAHQLATLTVVRRPRVGRRDPQGAVLPTIVSAIEIQAAVLRQVNESKNAVARQIVVHSAPLAEQVALLVTIPGITPLTAKEHSGRCHVCAPRPQSGGGARDTDRRDSCFSSPHSYSFCRGSSEWMAFGLVL